MKSDDTVQAHRPNHREAPKRLFSTIRFIGPGLILSAAIVGSGELIATTALGAKAGFTFLWIILAGCLIKVAVQLEYGRQCILSGKPSFRAWNDSSGWKLRGIHWSNWIAFLFMLSMFIGLAGVLGGASQVILYLFPETPIELWVGVLAIGLALLVFKGRYGLVELLATGLNLIFVGAVLFCVIAVQKTQFAFTLGDLGAGLLFKIPADALPLAIGAFGITGVGAAEIFTYPYWCLEKGYALWTGTPDGTEEWVKRARGWIRVMTMDAVVAMVVYTVTTCAFYLLGATVLRPQENLADGNALIEQLSSIFTGVLGPQAMFVFMMGAFAVLFSTVFSNCAGYARLWTDFFTICGFLQLTNKVQQLRSIAIMAWVLPITWGLVYITIQKPLFLVVFMGISNAVFLLVVAYKALVFRHGEVGTRVKPSWFYDIFLVVSVASIALMAIWALYTTFA